MSSWHRRRALPRGPRDPWRCLPAFQIRRHASPSPTTPRHRPLRLSIAAPPLHHSPRLSLARYAPPSHTPSLPRAHRHSIAPPPLHRPTASPSPHRLAIAHPPLQRPHRHSISHSPLHRSHRLSIAPPATPSHTPPLSRSQRSSRSRSRVGGWVDFEKVARVDGCGFALGGLAACAGAEGTSLFVRRPIGTLPKTPDSRHPPDSGYRSLSLTATVITPSIPYALRAHPTQLAYSYVAGVY